MAKALTDHPLMTAAREEAVRHAGEEGSKALGILLSSYGDGFYLLEVYRKDREMSHRFMWLINRNSKPEVMATYIPFAWRVLKKL